MRPNNTKRILEDGRVAVGIARSQLPTCEIPKMYAAADLNWVFLDSDHSPFSSDVVHDLIRAYRMTDITMVVRGCDFQYDLVARALDSGAEGIIFPRCEDPEHRAHATPARRIRGAALVTAPGLRPGTLFDPSVVRPPHWHRIQHVSQPGLDLGGGRNVADV